MELKLTNIGNSVGLILPKEARDKMKVGNGDSVYLTETPEGYKISPYDPEFDKEMEDARKLMKKRRAALRELAK
jgi:putative addiction module antidote